MIALTFETFGSVPLTVRPQSVVIDEGEGMHDVYAVTLQDSAARSISAAIGKPARVTCQSGLFAKIVYGYFDTTAPSLTDRESTGSYFLLGATSIMRNGEPRVWTDAHPYNIARELTKPHGFGLEFERYPHTLPFFSQSTESDWQTLQRLASECGMSLTSNGMTIRVVDVLQETRRWMAVSSPVAYKTPSVKSVTGTGIPAHSFTIIDSKTPLGGEQYTFHGVDSFGVSFQVSGGVSTLKKHQPVSVGSLGEALRESRRLDALNRYLTRGVLEGPGSMQVRAGTCIALDDRNGERSIWYVTSARHMFDAVENTYRMRMELLRHDGEGVNMPLPSHVVSSVRPQAALFGEVWRGNRDWAVEL